MATTLIQASVDEPTLHSLNNKLEKEATDAAERKKDKMRKDNVLIPKLDMRKVAHHLN